MYPYFYPSVNAGRKYVVLVRVKRGELSLQELAELIGVS
jgi:hypothetical protein